VALGQVFLPVLWFSPVTIIPPLLHIDSSIYHPRYILVMLLSQYFSFPLSVSFHHYSLFIHHLPPTLYNVFLPILQFFPVCIIPPLLLTYSSIYHRRCIILFLPVLQCPPVCIIPPLLHTYSPIYHRRCIMFFSQYFSFTLSVSYDHCSILIHSSTTDIVRTYNVFSPITSAFPCQYHSTNASYSVNHLPTTLYNVFLPVFKFSSVAVIPPVLHTPIQNQRHR
jgi:hypothetical protein